MWQEVPFQVNNYQLQPTLERGELYSYGPTINTHSLTTANYKLCDTIYVDIIMPYEMFVVLLQIL